MKRSDFLKRAIGLIGIAANPTALSTLAEKIPEVKKIKSRVTVGSINKCYISCLDPLLDTREVDSIIDKYSNTDWWQD